VEMTEPVIWNNGREAPNGFNWQWRCTGCGIDESSTYGSQSQAAYAVKRHRQTNRHLGKRAPVRGQEPQQPELHEATLRGLTTRQFGELISLVGRWFVEDNGEH